MFEKTRNRDLIKIVLGIAAAVLAFFIGRNVAKEIRRRRTETH